MKKYGRRSRRKSLQIIAVTMASAFVLTACGAGGMSQTGANGEAIMKTNPPYGPDHMMSKAMTGYTESLDSVAPGAFQYEHYYADSLVTQPEVADSLNSGLIDLGYLGMAYTPASYPIDGWASQIGYGGDPRPVVGLLSNAAAMVEWAYTVPELAEELDQSGIYPILPRLQNHDNYQMLCKDSVKSLSDTQGKRVRVGGTLYSDTVESLGMSPVTLSGGEIYEGFERGVVDCFVGAEPDMTGLGLWEVGTNFVKVDFPGWNSVSLASSNGFVASLNPDQKETIDESRSEFMRLYFEGYFDEKKYFYQGADEMEITFIEPESDLQNAVDSHFQSVRQNMIDNAPESIEDPAGAVERFEEIRQKWVDIVVDLGYDQGYADYTEWSQATGDKKVDLQPWADKLDEEIFANIPELTGEAS